jgi:hypothetical protein
VRFTPISQLQVPFAMLLAVMTLQEEITVLQAIGTALMLGGSFITQGNAGKSGKASALLPAGRPIPTIPSQEELTTPEPKHFGGGRRRFESGPRA